MESIHRWSQSQRGQERESGILHRWGTCTHAYFHSDCSRVWRGSLPLILALQKFLDLGQHCGAQIQLPQGARETAEYDAISHP